MGRKIEVVLLTEDGMWETEVIEAPAKASESQNDYIEWVYSEAGEDFRATWYKTVVATYWWAEVEADDPRLEEEEE
tara:strand:+ start:859 stop:1086 length:228 start_codon:yes stop_codon:yes gene_type:complete